LIRVIGLKASVKGISSL